MTGFQAPAGRTFFCAAPQPLEHITHDLAQIAAYLQALAPAQPLEQYDDWLQHDGLHLPSAQIAFADLIQMTQSPEGIRRATPDDDLVRIGIAPPQLTWYLRFRAVQADQGDYDLTLPADLLADFRAQCLPRLRAPLGEEDATRYFARIALP